MGPKRPQHFSPAFRVRLSETAEPRLHTARFAVAPYLHKNNEPMLHAMLLRAAEQGKVSRVYMLWFAAEDTPENPAHVAKSPERLQSRWLRFLQFHDQQTNGIPGLNILYKDRIDAFRRASRSSFDNDAKSTTLNDRSSFAFALSFDEAPGGSERSTPSAEESVPQSATNQS